MASAPPLAPDAGSRPLYFVLCDYGPKVGQSYYEADPNTSDRDTVVAWLAAGQYSKPQQVIEVDVCAGTARDVSEDVANEVASRLLESRAAPPRDTQQFLERFNLELELA